MGKEAKGKMRAWSSASDSEPKDKAKRSESPRKERSRSSASQEKEKDRGKGKEKDKEKHKKKDKGKEKDKDKDKEKDKDKDEEKDKDKDQDKDKDKDNENDEEQDKDKKDRSASRSEARSKSRSKSRKKERSNSRKKERSKSRKKGKDRSRSRKKNRSKSRKRERSSRSRKKDRSRSGKKRSRSRRNRSKSRRRRSKSRGKDRSRSRKKDRSRSRKKGRSRSAKEKRPDRRSRDRARNEERKKRGGFFDGPGDGAAGGMFPGAPGMPLLGAEAGIDRPPNPEVEAFLAANPELRSEGASQLRSLPEHVQKAVVSRGSLSGARDATAMLMSRCRDAMAQPPPPGSVQAMGVPGGPGGVHPGIEELIGKWNFDARCTAALRALPRDKQDQAARMNLEGARNPSALCMVKVQNNDFGPAPLPQTPVALPAQTSSGLGGFAVPGMMAPSGMAPMADGAHAGIEELIRKYNLDASCAQKLRSLPPDKKDFAARMNLSEARNPNAYCMTKIIQPTFGMGMQGQPSPPPLGIGTGMPQGVHGLAMPGFRPMGPDSAGFPSSMPPPPGVPQFAPQGGPPGVSPGCGFGWTAPGGMPSMPGMPGMPSMPGMPGAPPCFPPAPPSIPRPPMFQMPPGMTPMDGAQRPALPGAAAFMGNSGSFMIARPPPPQHAWTPQPPLGCAGMMTRPFGQDGCVAPPFSPEPHDGGCVGGGGMLEAPRPPIAQAPCGWQTMPAQSAWQGGPNLAKPQWPAEQQEGGVGLTELDMNEL